MIRSKRILRRHSATGNGAVFTNDFGGASPDTRLVLTLESYHDMGSPEEITITIEPGDTLNDHPKGSL